VSSLPRTLVLRRALAPGGSAYVQIELDQAQAGYVAMRTSCEEPVSYVWSLLVLDENHHVQRHVPVTFREQSFHEEARIGELAHAHALVAVGTNLGGVDLAHPFDPDHGP